MLLVHTVPLPPDTATALVTLQADIDMLHTYAERVAAAKRDFPAKNKKGNAIFDAVKDVLTAMCAGRRRCMYCEDSAADEVEHVCPKDLYPEVVFAWMNYLYACGPCNSPKGNKFEVFSTKTGIIVNVTRPPKAPVTEPEQGDPVLIDPRRDDPFTFMRLDIRDTFHFRPMHARGTKEFDRAEYTIRTLHLNDRAHLPSARQDAYVQYRSLLHTYIVQREAADASRSRTVKVLHRTHHPTVWAEMKRQHEKIADLRALFKAAPEALTW